MMHGMPVSSYQRKRKAQQYLSDVSQNVNLVKEYMIGWNKQTGSGLGTLGWLLSSKSDWNSITGGTTYFENSIIWLK